MSAEDTSTNPDPVSISASRQFAAWLAESGISLGFSTYQSGKVFLIGHNSQGSLSIFERTLERPMGMWSDGETLLLSSLYQLYRFRNAIPPGETSDDYDRLYAPRTAHFTGDLDIHDLAWQAENARPVFINTLFSCLATTSEEHSFLPLWQPPFITRLAPEDRCHLNGLALRDDTPAFVTAVSTTDIADGWREHRGDGGVVIDVASNEIITRGLSMPHSPRWHRDRLWLANSGTGEFGFIDGDTGRFEPVTFCPGYVRGIAMHGKYAIVGMSRPRGNKTFSGLALEDRLNSERVGARCGLAVIDLETGNMPHWLQIEGVVTELYDVVTLPGATRPSLIGFRSDQVRRVISIAPNPDD